MPDYLGTEGLATKSEFGTDANILADILEAIGSAKIEFTRPEGTGWRIEVIQKGKAYIWRRGYGKKRESRPGAKFDTLLPERKLAYYANVERRKNRASDNATDTPTIANQPRRRGRPRKDTPVAP